LIHEFASDSNSEWLDVEDMRQLLEQAGV